MLVTHFHDAIVLRNKEPIDHVVLGQGSLDLKRIAQLIKKTECKYALIEVFRTKELKRPSERKFKQSISIARKLFA